MCLPTSQAAGRACMRPGNRHGCNGTRPAGQQPFPRPCGVSGKKARACAAACAAAGAPDAGGCAPTTADGMPVLSGVIGSAGAAPPRAFAASAACTCGNESAALSAAACALSTAQGCTSQNPSAAYASVARTRNGYLFSCPAEQPHFQHVGSVAWWAVLQKGNSSQQSIEKQTNTRQAEFLGRQGLQASHQPRVRACAAPGTAAFAAGP